MPDEKIVPVHGTIGKVKCEVCEADYPVDEFRDMVRKNIRDIYGILISLCLFFFLCLPLSFFLSFFLCFFLFYFSFILSGGKSKCSCVCLIGVEKDAPDQSSTIPCLSCGEPKVKPATVLYGRSLPQQFFHTQEEDFPHNVDLLIVMVRDHLSVFHFFVPIPKGKKINSFLRKECK